MTDPQQKSKRVLFIAPQPFLEWRGSPLRVSFNLRALTELGYEVDLLTFPFGDAVEIPGAIIHRVPRLPGMTRVGIGPSIGKALLDVLLAAKGICMVLRTRYAVIHGVEEAGAIALFLAPWRSSCVVFEKHSDPMSYRSGWWRNRVLDVYAWVERCVARRADAVIATGPGLVAQIRPAAGVTPVHHIADIPSSLSEARPARVAEIRAEQVRERGDVLVAYVGSFATYQGIDLLFQSIPVVIQLHAQARFVIVGGSAEAVAIRRQALAAAGVADRVTFVPQIPPDDLPNFLAAMDVLLSPRLSGINTPLKLLDYLKAGRAVVATDTAANRFILDADCAVIAPATVEGFAAGIGRAVGDAALRERLGREGKTRIQNAYNYRLFKAGLEACYAAMVPDGTRAR